MRAVWSFWTKPFLAERRSSWASELHHWLAWGLSVAAARLHYPETQLVTDDAGARLLVDVLQLPFASVSTALNCLEDEDPGWWSLGKLEAYGLQSEPFVHIDTDVILWNRLRPELERAALLAQNPEPITFGRSCYQPDQFERLLSASWLPQEWRWYRRNYPVHARAECCGVFGGNQVDFIRKYASTALRLLRDPRNQKNWKSFDAKEAHMILLEQFLLTACIEYQRQHANPSFPGMDIQYVFEFMEDAYSEECATAAGYTHLAAGAKRSWNVARNLEARVQSDLPDYYARCMDLCRGSEARSRALIA